MALNAQSQNGQNVRVSSWTWPCKYRKEISRTEGLIGLVCALADLSNRFLLRDPAEGAI
jgi:hypothetical protein